jgi:hypothetical protein
MMAPLRLLFALLSVGVAASPARPGDLLPRDCGANNCLRQVRNTKSLAVRSADCSSFLRYTVTPVTTLVCRLLTSLVQP